MVVKALGAIGFGIVFAGLGIYMYWNKQKLMQKAVSVQAEVLDTRVEERRQAEGPDDDIPDKQYYPKVRYQFTYNGGKHQSNSVYPGGEQGKGTREDAEKVLQDFQEGQQVQAFVNPDDPDESFLIKTSGYVPLLLVPFGLMAIGLGIYMLV